MTVATTTYHVSLCIASLVRLPDEQLLQHVHGASASELRMKLVIKRAAGQQRLTVAGCTSRNRDGSCAGHHKQREP